MSSFRFWLWLNFPFNFPPPLLWPPPPSSPLIPSIHPSSPSTSSSSPEWTSPEMEPLAEQLKTVQVLFRDVWKRMTAHRRRGPRAGTRCEGQKRRTSGWECLQVRVRVCHRGREAFTQLYSQPLIWFPCFLSISSQLKHNGTTFDFNVKVILRITRWWQMLLK